MATATEYPTTVADAAGIGSVVWTDPGNAASNDNTYATVEVEAGSGSRYLKATDFGFDLPLCRVNRVIQTWWAFGESDVVDAAVRFVIGGAIQATDHSSAVVWPGVETAREYAATVEELDQDVINSSGFGAAIAVARSAGDDPTFSADSVAVTVDYTRLYRDAKEAVVALRDYLQTVLDDDYSDELSSYGPSDSNGADVILEDDEPQESDRTGKPYIVLSVDEDTVAESAGPTRAIRRATVSAEIVANDYSGAQTGAENPEGSDTKLVRALLQIIDGGYAEIRDDLGLMGISIEASGEEIDETEDNGPESHRNPHRIMFDYEIYRG